MGDVACVIGGGRSHDGGPNLESHMNTERWEIDSSHSGIHFSVRHLVIAKVRGKFERSDRRAPRAGGIPEGRHRCR